MSTEPDVITIPVEADTTYAGSAAITFSAVGPISSGVLDEESAAALAMRFFGVPRWVFFFGPRSRRARLRRMHQMYRRRRH